MDYKLEVVVVPVGDVDRAKDFYSERCGFVVDVDSSPMSGVRVVQLTPPGSACSIMVGTGILESPPGVVKGLQLVVDDLDAAREELLGRGLEISEVRHVADDGSWQAGHGGPWNSFCFFEDPDGNGWAVQQRPADR